ncbi:hypothetical protein [Paenibacillus sinopodophylli]|uniref:hypothetical protein n=1 Tax=Paenibacillus sinopodophylli TaxID=1837342 RepID=UPI00110C9325|nr:hypothetical protein [Paenibacillus sinopodophylli]
MENYFTYELEAITRWVKATAGLSSMLLSAAPPTVARPVILWEAPQRSRDRNISRYVFVNKVRQYGRLFAADLLKLLDYQARLQLDLEDRDGLLEVFDRTGTVIGKLKEVTVRFETSEALDVPFSVEYEATYSRNRPVDPPAASTVITNPHYNPPG